MTLSEKRQRRPTPRSDKSEHNTFILNPEAAANFPVVLENQWAARTEVETAGDLLADRAVCAVNKSLLFWLQGQPLLTDVSRETSAITREHTRTHTRAQIQSNAQVSHSSFVTPTQPCISRLHLHPRMLLAAGPRTGGITNGRCLRTLLGHNE